MHGKNSGISKLQVVVVIVVVVVALRCFASQVPAKVPVVTSPSTKSPLGLTPVELNGPAPSQSVAPISEEQQAPWQAQLR